MGIRHVRVRTAVAHARASGPTRATPPPNQSYRRAITICLLVQTTSAKYPLLSPSCSPNLARLGRGAGARPSALGAGARPGAGAQPWTTTCTELSSVELSRHVFGTNRRRRRAVSSPLPALAAAAAASGGVPCAIAHRPCGMRSIDMKTCCKWEEKLYALARVVGLFPLELSVLPLPNVGAAAGPTARSNAHDRRLERPRARARRRQELRLRHRLQA